MKELTPTEFAKAPTDVQYIFICAVYEMPINGRVLEKAINDHPEYFEDEVALRDRWDAIPSEVHESYWKEFLELKAILFKDLPENKGMYYWSTHPAEFKEWSKTQQTIMNESFERRKALHEKYYSEYGIEFTD